MLVVSCMFATLLCLTYLYMSIVLLHIGINTKIKKISKYFTIILYRQSR